MLHRLERPCPRLAPALAPPPSALPPRARPPFSALFLSRVPEFFSSVCCVCDLGRCLFPFSRWNMTPTSARAFVSSAPRCAPVATAAHAPVGALPFPARTCVGVAPSQHAPVWAWPLPQPRAQGPALPPADSHLPPGLHQVRVRQLAAGPRAVPVHWHPLGHLLPARLRRGMPPPNPAPAGHLGDRGSSFHTPKGGGESVCGRPGHHPDPGPPRKPSFLGSHRCFKGEAEFHQKLLRGRSSGRAPQAEPGPGTPGAESRSRASREGDVSPPFPSRSLVRVIGGTKPQHPGHAPAEWEPGAQGFRCPRDREPVVSGSVHVTCQAAPAFRQRPGPFTATPGRGAERGSRRPLLPPWPWDQLGRPPGPAGCQPKGRKELAPTTPFSG